MLILRLNKLLEIPSHKTRRLKANIDRIDILKFEMMVSKLLELCFGLFLAFLTTVVYGDHHDQLVEKLNQMAREKRLIHEYRAVENGFIKRGLHSSVFRGERNWDNLKVAMKYTPKSLKQESDREYEMYSYLGAIDNTEVEKFGFSAVHYYNEWNENDLHYMIMVFSRFDEDLINALNRGCFNCSSKQGAVNSLILFRNFVRQSKYMHTNGIRNDDIEPENIMLRGFQSFIIDFNLGSKMTKNSDKGTFLYTSRRCHKIHVDKKKFKRNALDDYESFLYTMCKVNKVNLEWFKYPFHKMEPKEAFELCGKMKDNTTSTIEHIKATIKSDPLLNIFLAFADEAFNDQNVFPNYNQLDELITNEINRVLNPSGIVTRKPIAPIFTWLSYVDRDEGEKFLIKYSVCLVAKHIREPDPKSIKYDPVEYNYFFKPMERLERRKSDQLILQLAKIFTLCDKNFDFI